jgi:hypothetical protein
MEGLSRSVEDRLAVEAAKICPLQEELAELTIRLDAGISTSVVNPRTPQPLEAVLGVDFGTSSTKIVARLPYLPGEPCFAVPVPSFARAEGHPHLWSSRLWLDGGGRLSLAPVEGGKVRCGIKSGLMHPQCERRIAIFSGTHSATDLEAACAFLALQVRQARGWILASRAVEFGRGPITWTYNVGFPAASLDDSSLRRRYQVCIEAAVRLSETRGDLEIPAVRHALAAQSQEAGRRIAWHAALVPEIAAAVAGFARSRMREDGLYAMVDVGAGTLDCCTFNLFANDQGLKCAIFTADVSMLGVQPLEVAEKVRSLAAEFRHEILHRQKEVVWTTKLKRYSNSARWRTGLPVFLVGGGTASLVHRDASLELDPWLKSSGAGGGARLLRLPVPEGLDFEGSSEALHRLAVAVGLSLPTFDIPTVELPRAIDDEQIYQPVRSYEDRYTSKDMV